MAEPRIGKFTANTTITWADGHPFDGYILVGFSHTILVADLFPDIRVRNTGDGEPLPPFYKIPIKEGLADQSVGLFYNEDLIPHTSQYYAWLYTNKHVQATSPGLAFSVTTATISIPPFSTATPGAGDAPTPDTYPPNGVVVPPTIYALDASLNMQGHDILNLDDISGDLAVFERLNLVSADDLTSLDSLLKIDDFGLNSQAQNGLIRVTSSNALAANNLLVLVNSNGIRFAVNGAGRMYWFAGTTYADDAAAGAGGLTTGQVYSTATGELRIKL